MFKAALKTWENETAIIYIIGNLFANHVIFQTAAILFLGFSPWRGCKNCWRDQQPHWAWQLLSEVGSFYHFPSQLHSFWYLLWGCSSIHSLYGNDYEILHDFLHSEKLAFKESCFSFSLEQYTPCFNLIQRWAISHL